MKLSGGYSIHPEWLGDRLACYGTIERFIQGQNELPAAVVRLDEPITAMGTSGVLVVLELRFEGTRWGRRETVHVELCDFEPEDAPWARRRQGTWIESHATIELE